METLVWLSTPLVLGDAVFVTMVGLTFRSAGSLFPFATFAVA